MKHTIVLGLVGLMAIGAAAHAQDSFWYRHSVPGISTPSAAESEENQSPVVSGAPSGIEVDADETIAPFSGIVVSDLDEEILAVTVTVDVPQAGSFTPLGDFTDSGDGLYSFNGLPDAATAALQALIFVPTEGRLDAGEDEAIEFVALVKDAAGESASAVVGLIISKAESGSGTLWAFGANYMYQLGIPDGIARSVPTRVGEATGWSSISVGWGHGLAVKSDGTLWIWGDNMAGVSAPQPTRVGTHTNWAIALSGQSHAFALKSDGTLWGWGPNMLGQLGVGDRSARTEPTQVNGDTNRATVATAQDYTVALKTDGSLWAWGSSHPDSPTQVGADTNWTAISSGDGHTLALKSDGSLYSWGINYQGQLGLGAASGSPTVVPTRIGTGTGWSAVAAAGGRSFALTSDGSMWAWGHNFGGSLGLGHSTNPAVPTQIGTESQWARIYAGWRHAIAVKDDGTVWGWGENTYGELGINPGSLAVATVPTMLSHGHTWKTIAVGTEFTIAIE